MARELKDAQTAEPIPVDTANLTGSLLQIAINSPDGNSLYSYDETGHVLIPVSKELTQADDFILAIRRQPGRVFIADSWAINYLSADSTCLDIELDDKNRIKFARFQNGMHTNPSVSIALEEEGEGLRSRGHIYISSCHLALDYEGDGHILKFDHLEKYSRAQLALVFKNGQVPDVDINKLVYESVVLGYRRTRYPEIALPTLTFNPNHRDYHARCGHIYLVQDEETLPKVESGSIISGVLITEASKRPYHLKVSIKSLKEVDFKYSNGPGKATLISGKIEINSGNRRDFASKLSRFRVNSGLRYLKENPQLVPGYAAKEFLQGKV